MNPSFDPCDLPRLFDSALLPAIRLHRAWDLPMAVWENGAVVWKSPDEIERERGASQSQKTVAEGGAKTPVTASGN